MAKWRAALTSNHGMNWADFLAMASDMQLVPYLMGVEALKAAMHQVSALSNLAQGEVGSSSKNELNTIQPMSMRYPQFVEALTLLASSAAGRLRPLYPDVAGQTPAAHPSSTIDKASGSPRGRERIVRPARLVVDAEQSITGGGEQAGRKSGQSSWARGQTVNALRAVAKMKRNA